MEECAQRRYMMRDTSALRLALRDFLNMQRDIVGSDIPKRLALLNEANQELVNLSLIMIDSDRC
jgi:hypothetical protein